VFIGLNSWMRRQRRRLAMLAVMLGLAGTVVVAHSATGHHMGDLGEAVVMCLAVAETAAVAAGVALALGAWTRRPLWLVAAPPLPELLHMAAGPGVRPRAGPPALGVFRL